MYCTLLSASVQLAFFLIFSYKPARHFAPCRLDTPLSSITTLIQQSPLPFRLHSWLPSTNPPYLTLCFITLPFSPLFLPFLLHPPPPPTSFTLSPYSSYICLICPYSCTISSYTGFVIHNDAYDVMLGLHHNAEMYISPAAVFCSPWLPLTTTTISIFARQHIFSSTVSFSN